MPDQWFHKVFEVSEANFEDLALDIFRFQYEHNPVYKAYAEQLKIHPNSVHSISAIPFLPIRFFKTHRVVSTVFEPGAVFESSGTTSTINSHHFVNDLALYRASCLKGFELFYGTVRGSCVVGLLPSYSEKSNSSLACMVADLVQRSNHPQSGFYLHDLGNLKNVLTGLERAGQKTFLIGLSFALLDFAEQFPVELRHTIIIETGGMKGRRPEMIRSELHGILKNAFGTEKIHSEYGMTELLSQAYSHGDGIFRSVPWMKILIRDEEDPFELTGGSASPMRGGINIIDLANVYSCSFIATEDAGQIFGDGSFEVLGRLDNSDVRGCSLMAM